jgi:hypothetical protein
LVFLSESTNPRGSTTVDGFQQLHRNGDGNEFGKSSWYLDSYADGTYDYQHICDENDALTGTRGAGDTGPAAWICKGTLPRFVNDPP